MNIRIHQTPEGDVVRLAGRGRVEMKWEAWLKTTEVAVSCVRRTMDTPRVLVTDEQLALAQEARAWLGTCGVHTALEFYDLEKHLPLLRQPADRFRARRCMKCGARIWGREAVLTGIGSACRHVRGVKVATTLTLERA